MIGCGTATFTDPDEYRLSVPGATIDLVLTGSDRFRARVTWVNLPRLALALVEESVGRIAVVSLSSKRVFVSFPLRGDPLPIWNGVEVRPGEMVLHGRGERFHQRTTKGARWGLVSLTEHDLAGYGRALLQERLVLPQAMAFLRPPSRVGADFGRLHRQACRLAQTKPDVTAHPEVARALAQGLIHALVSCVTARPVRECTTGQHCAEIMDRFEQVLALHRGGPPPTAERCAAVGASERTLRACCSAFLGIGPVGYDRLRRLNMVHSALLRSDGATTTIAMVAREHGFAEPRRFAAAYRAVFGESPAATLERSHCDVRMPVS